MPADLPPECVAGDRFQMPGRKDTELSVDYAYDPRELDAGPRIVTAGEADGGLAVPDAKLLQCVGLAIKDGVRRTGPLPVVVPALRGGPELAGGS